MKTNISGSYLEKASWNYIYLSCSTTKMLKNYGLSFVDLPELTCVKQGNTFCNPQIFTQIKATSYHIKLLYVYFSNIFLPLF
jgi:hypothetical protein